MINDFLDFCQKNDGRQKNKQIPVRKKWKEVEDELLLKAIRKYGNQWSKIQEEVPTKDSKQCQARWKILKHVKSLKLIDVFKKVETMDRMEALDDYSEMENQNNKAKKMQKKHREIPRKYNPHFDYNEESSSESMHLQQFQQALTKQPNQLSLLQQQEQQRKREQIQKQALTQYQNVWNAMDDKMLWAAFKIYKGVWNQITSRFQEKNPQSCMERYSYLLQQKKMKLQQDGSSVDIISSMMEDSSHLGSEQFDITMSEGGDSTDQQLIEHKITTIGIYTVQQCHTNIERILKSFSNHNLDTLPGIRESIVKLIITD